MQTSLLYSTFSSQQRKREENLWLCFWNNVLEMRLSKQSKICLLVLHLFCFQVSAFSGPAAWCASRSFSRTLSYDSSSGINRRSSLYETYGRGAEIWPPANEDPMRLESSFPNGVIPDVAVAVLNNAGQPPKQETFTNKRRRYVPRAIGRILRRAANAQEETASDTPPGMDKTPMVLAALLVASGMIRPLDALLVCFLSGYFVILFYWARSLRSDGYTPVLPSLPPQGHVPNLVANPLGAKFTSCSLGYDYWLRIGALLGLLAPIGMVIRYIFTRQMDLAIVCARPIFLISCQAITEAISRRFLVSSGYIS